MERPDYVICALLGLYEEGTERKINRTWCGRIPSVFEFTFSDASHALLNARNGGRLLVCQGCAKTMHETLEAGTYTEGD